MIRSLLVGLVVLAFTATTAVAEDKEGPGTSVVKAANEKIAKLLKAKASPAKVTAGVRDFIDIDELGRRALADHWSGLKDSEQKEYLEILRKLIEDNYSRGVSSNVDYKVVYTGETTTDKGDLVVSTEVKAKRKGRPLTIAIDYVLVKDAAGKWKAYDVKTDGIGLVENYRAQFNKIIDKDGFSGLIAKMKKRLAEDTKADAKKADADPGAATKTKAGG
jgi:phospholipid transport system substrate-binding protein